MQIVTLEDVEFPALRTAWGQCTLVGKYCSKNSELYVGITNQFVLVAHGANPKKIAVRAARNLEDAKQVALRILSREKANGKPVEILAEFQR